jgi:hypothetical protein
METDIGVAIKSRSLRVEVMRAVPISSRGSEFHAFLYAPISEDREGMTLSVLSALARQELDPWIEAARLSHLPQKTAIEQIMGLLEVLPGRILASLDREEVASRLSALLPRQAAPNLFSALLPPGTEGRKPTKIDLNWRFFYLYFCLMMLMNWLMMELRTPPAAAITEAQTSAATVSPEPGTKLASKDPVETPNSDH